MNKTYGYIRVSPDPDKSSLNLELAAQKGEILNVVNIKEEDLFCDIHSGETFDRPEWKKLKDLLQPGDRVVATTVKAVSTNTLASTLKEIESISNRGIQFDIVEFDITKKTWVQILNEVYSYFEQLRLQRQKTSLAIIAANPILKQSKYPGRKTILDDDFLEKVQQLLQQNITSPTELSRQLQISRSSIYKALKLLRDENRTTKGDQEILKEEKIL